MKTTKIQNGIYNIKINNSSFVIVRCKNIIMTSDKWHVYNSKEFNVDSLCFSAETKKQAIKFLKEDLENGFIK